MSQWDHTPHQKAGVFLDLKGKGDSVDIRIAGPIYHEIKIFRDGEQKPVDDAQVALLSEDDIEALRKKKTAEGKDAFSISDKYSVAVLDRGSGSEAKLFTMTAGVFNKIKKHALDERWGDPMNYDFNIVRTEAPGANYYEVMADPRKSELTEEEKARAAEIDVQALKPYAKSLEETPAPATNPAVANDLKATASTAPAAPAAASASLADEL